MRQSLGDPTYDQSRIEANPVWHLAWSLSEIMNDNAPSGWSRYCYAAKCLIANWHIARKTNQPTSYHLTTPRKTLIPGARESLLMDGQRCVATIVWTDDAREADRERLGGLSTSRSHGA